MQGTSQRLELLPAPDEIDRVVAVPSISRAPTHAHEAPRSQQTEVVRHQALPLTEEVRQLADRAVADRELAQHAPPKGIRQQVHESRWIIRGSA
jgi:hypothetical protein